MTSRERVETVLKGGCADKVPFTIYEAQIPQCQRERELRNRGLCIVKRDVQPYIVYTPNVRTTQQTYWENGRKFTKTYYETPVGTLSILVEAAGFTSWTHEKMFKSPEDYKAILALVKDENYMPCYENLIKAQDLFGGDAVFRAGMGLEPLQMLISSSYMAMETFCTEWMDNRDEILKIYDAIVENRRKLYKIIAASPVLHANYGGNVVPEIIGLENFKKYYVPHYNEAAEVFHKHGKLIGCHFDDDCGLLSGAIAATKLDYIEAFTPAPDTDMTLAQARKAWPDKVIWINFPSSVHLKNNTEVERCAGDMLSELNSIDGIIYGITEDIPEHRWQDSCKAIMDGLDRHACENPDKYRK